MSLCNPSKFCISREQISKVFELIFSIQTVAASCFRPTTVCSAVTKTCGEGISFALNKKKYSVCTSRLLYEYQVRASIFLIEVTFPLKKEFLKGLVLE